VCQQINREQNWVFRIDQRQGEKLAASYLAELKKGDFEKLYEFCIDASTETQKDDPTIVDFENKPYKVLPLVGYSLDWSRLEKVEKVTKVEDFMQYDTINLILITKDGDRTLGDMKASNENGKWGVWASSVKDSGDSAFEKALKHVQEGVKEVFILTYTPPKYKFNRYVIGYKEKGKVKIISFSYGSIQKSDNINIWFNEWKILQYK